MREVGFFVAKFLLVFLPTTSPHYIDTCVARAERKQLPTHAKIATTKVDKRQSSKILHLMLFRESTKCGVEPLIRPLSHDVNKILTSRRPIIIFIDVCKNCFDRVRLPNTPA